MSKNDSAKATKGKDKSIGKKGTILQQKERNFTFPNGDSYHGEFAVNLQDKNIFKHGIGTYRTNDGHSYSGKWIDDKLIGPVVISLRNESIYQGSITTIPEYTTGKYIFGDTSQLTGDYKKNFANGDSGVTFYDPNGKIWNHQLTEDGKQIILKYDWLNEGKENNADDSCESDGSEEFEI